MDEKEGGQDSLMPNGKSTTASSAENGSLEESAKRIAILDACKNRDLEALRDLAISEGGLLSDTIRHEACKSKTLPTTRSWRSAVR
jgi:hypothetical protein